MLRKLSARRFSHLLTTCGHFGGVEFWVVMKTFEKLRGEVREYELRQWTRRAEKDVLDAQRT
jgi:hypothetical protein